MHLTLSHGWCIRWSGELHNVQGETPPPTQSLQLQLLATHRRCRWPISNAVNSISASPMVDPVGWRIDGAPIRSAVLSTSKVTSRFSLTKSELVLLQQKFNCENFVHMCQRCRLSKYYVTHYISYMLIVILYNISILVYIIIFYLFQLERHKIQIKSSCIKYITPKINT